MHDKKYFEGLVLPYSIEKIPDWCTLHPKEHACAGGCWSIYYDQLDVFTKCSKCESSTNYIIPNAICINNQELASQIKVVI